MSHDEKKKGEYSLKDIYEKMELELIASFYRNLVKHHEKEMELGYSWEMWQAAKLRNLEIYRKDTLKITQHYNKEIEESIKSVLDKSYDKGYNHVADSINMPMNTKNVGKINKKPPAETQFFGINKRKLNALIESTQNDFKEANKAIYRQMDDVYRQTIHNAEFQMASGAVSLGQAIDIATKEFLNKGINCIIYKDGRRVNVASYAEMALRTASQRATFLGEGTKRDELGVFLVMVSVHANACEMCLPYQGEVLIDDVFAHPGEEFIDTNKQYVLLSEAIKKGFLHPQCRHTLINYIEGVTRKISKVPDEKVLENYYIEQKQRKLENAIRKQKRIVKGTVDKDNKKDATRKLRNLQSELKELLNANSQFNRNKRREKDSLGPLTDEEKNDIMVSEIKNILGKPKSLVSIVPKQIQTDTLNFDDKHINIERAHHVSRDEAIRYIKDAKISVAVWNGKFERYYGEEGAVYVDIDNHVIRTCFKKEEYDSITQRILEVLEKNGK